MGYKAAEDKDRPTPSAGTQKICSSFSTIFRAGEPGSGLVPASVPPAGSVPSANLDVVWGARCSSFGTPFAPPLRRPNKGLNIK
ncbi:hypothetical protein O3P69_008816 [Scylla paramamosain]|uniref:Uncharacterized protein n=1 Tax=Scylla paramamosain TaxID=85552 RepID=A0AAW0TPX1_SCYPA